MKTKKTRLKISRRAFEMMNQQLTFLILFGIFSTYLSQAVESNLMQWVAVVVWYVSAGFVVINLLISPREDDLEIENPDLSEYNDGK